MDFPLIRAFLLLLFAIEVINCECANKTWIRNEWNEFKKLNNKKYSTPDEEAHRFNNFETSCKVIEEHNILYNEGKSTYTLGITPFADKTLKEIEEAFPLNRTPNGNNTARVLDEMKFFKYDRNVVVPAALDWREKNFVTSVKDQMDCGSCYAFSTLGAVEAHYLKETGTEIDLSEQEIVDCVTENNGCSGGSLPMTLWYLVNNYVSYEESYPYVNNNGGSCKDNTTKVDFKLFSYAVVHPSTEENLMKAVTQIGPVQITIDYLLESFMHYKGGIYNDPACGKHEFSHAMLVVGYGHDDKTGLDYWILKNSFTETWGENGYMRVIRNHNNFCGLASYSFYPMLSSNGSYYASVEELIAQHYKWELIIFMLIAIILIICLLIGICFLCRCLFCRRGSLSF